MPGLYAAGRTANAYGLAPGSSLLLPPWRHGCRNPRLRGTTHADACTTTAPGFVPGAVLRGLGLTLRSWGPTQTAQRALDLTGQGFAVPHPGGRCYYGSWICKGKKQELVIATAVDVNKTSRAKRRGTDRHLSCAQPTGC